MASKVDDVLDLCCEISARDQIKVAVRKAGKGAVVAGAGAFVGGLLLGPVGIAVGGAAGGLVGWLTSKQYRPLPEILMKLSSKKKKQLCDEVLAVLGNLRWKDARHLINLVMGTKGLQKVVRDALVRYVKNKLKAKVRYLA